MKQVTATLTQRSQVTVPIEVRRVLGLKPRDKVAFTIEDGEVRLTSASFGLELAYGSIQPSEKPEDFSDISRTSKAAKAEKTVQELCKASDSQIRT